MGKRNREEDTEESEGESVSLSGSTGDFGPTFDDVDEFVGALEEAKRNPSPLSAKLMGDLADYWRDLPAWRKAQLRKAGYRGETDKPVKLRLLLDLLLNLAAIKHDGRVNLSQEEAAAAVQTSRSYVWAWLHLMESAGVLRCVRRGSWHRKLSTTYEFGSADVAGVGDDNEPPF